MLKMIGMWFNTPLMIPRGMTTPTQNVVAGLGTFWQVDAPGGDVTKAARYAEKPIIPPDAWRVLDMALHGGEDVVGANSTTMQGNLGGPGSSAMRTAAGVNRVGVEHGDVEGNRADGPGLEFWGGSFLADPFGRIIAKASHDAEEILLGEIDLGLIEETRRNWPFLRDRRIDAYAPITQCYLDPVNTWTQDGEPK